jgi:hypothetical protein
MRQSNYRVGWYVPNQIAALTHFHPDVTAEDIQGVFQGAQELLQHVSNEFHMIIDNRVVGMSSPVSLSQIRQMAPFMNHPLLRWVVVVKPEHLALDTDSLPVEGEGETRLKNVASLEEAIKYLQQVTTEVQWQQADAAFFP